LLCDWLLHNQQQLAGRTVLELGAGVGLASILAARFAQRVLLTDADVDVLQLAASNARVNGVQDRVSVRRLDWLQLFDTQLCRCTEAEVLLLLNSISTSSSAAESFATHQPPGADTAEGSNCCGTERLNGYSWVPSDLQQLFAVDIWLAADVVYNETLTDAFMRTAHQLMAWQQQQRQQQQRQQQQSHQGQACSHVKAPCDAMEGASGSSGLSREGSCCLQGPRLLVAVEKRYNFTYRDLDARASAFEHFMTYVTQAPTAAAATAAQTEDCATEMAGQQAVQRSVHEAQQQQQQQQQQPGPNGANLTAPLGSKPLFIGRRLAVEELPQVSEVPT
jgi:predicted nicotinamide N-methyase